MQRIFFIAFFVANFDIFMLIVAFQMYQKPSDFCPRVLISSVFFYLLLPFPAVSVILLFVFELSYLHKSLRHFPGKLQQAFHLDCTLHNLLRYDFSPDKCILVSRFLQLAGLECVLLPDKYFQNTAVHNLVFPIQYHAENNLLCLSPVKISESAMYQ